MKKRIGVVADDVTGANDIGVMFAKGGYRSAVFPLHLTGSCDMESEAKDLDVIILDTDSRFDTEQEACRKVRQATQILKNLQCDRFHKKTCSVFRGNIGAEFDEMQDTLGVACSMVIAGFPANGRTTVDGIHYVYGQELKDSQFRDDPIHPMTTSSLREILAQQSARPSSCITWEDLDRGAAYVRERKEELKKDHAYLIFDVRDQTDLQTIAQAVSDEVSLCGSSAIGQELPAAYAQAEPDPGCFLLAGSLTRQSLAQVEYMRGQGCEVLTFDTGCIYEEERLAQTIRRLTRESIRSMRLAGQVLVHTSNSPADVAETKAAGLKLGLTHEEIGKRISHAMCTITRSVLEETGCRRLVVAGGDTSAAVTDELGIYRMEIGEEIEAGVPLMRGKSSLGELSLVLKSGSFGGEAFLYKAALQV